MRPFTPVPLLMMSFILSACTPEADMCGAGLDRRDVLLPLQVGNTWRYVDRIYGDSLILSVSRHARIGGKCFAVLMERRVIVDTQGRDDQKSVEFPLYLSYGPKGEIVTLPGLEDLEQLEDSIQSRGLTSLLRTYYDPGARIDSSWTIHAAAFDLTYLSRDVIRIRRDSAKVDITVPAGTFEDCIAFVVDEGNIHIDYMAPGVGMVSRRVSELGGGEFVLTSYDLK